MYNYLKKAIVISAAGFSALTLSTTPVQAQSSAPRATFYSPRARPANGTGVRSIWLTASNGFAFCKQYGYDTMESFTGTCGEDESSYLDHEFSTDTWIFRRSGSKNGCYPLFASITCTGWR